VSSNDKEDDTRKTVPLCYCYHPLVLTITLAQEKAFPDAYFLSVFKIILLTPEKRLSLIAIKEADPFCRLTRNPPSLAIWCSERNITVPLCLLFGKI